MPTLRSRSLLRDVPDVADLAGLMGPVGLPGAVAGVVSKVGRVLSNPKTIQMLDELLGQTVQMGKRTLRLSSFNPTKGLARLHDIASGERHISDVSDFVKRLMNAEAVPGIPAPLGKGVTKMTTSSGERFLKYPPSMAAPTQAGERIDKVTAFGPRGGVKLTRRKIPDTATR